MTGGREVGAHSFTIWGQETLKDGRIETVSPFTLLHTLGPSTPKRQDIPFGKEG